VWTDSAVCASIDPDVFFPTTGPAFEAKRACAICPVKTECLEDALAAEVGQGRNLIHGIRGGMSPSERFDLLTKIDNGAVCDESENLALAV
jgi:WhiB family redox-sensing transcriptional regulator